MKTNNTSTVKKGKHLFVKFIVCILIAIMVAQFCVEYCVRKQLVLISKNVLNKELTVDSVSYNLLLQQLIVEEINIKNSAEYSTTQPAIHVGKINIKVSLWDFLKQLIHIKHLYVSDVKINFELKKTPQSFWDIISIIKNHENNLMTYKNKKYYHKNKKQYVASFVRKNKSEEWFICIDDFKLYGANVNFVNLRNMLITYKFEFLKNIAFNGITLRSYSMKNIGADGKMTTSNLMSYIVKNQVNEIIDKIIPF